MSSIWLFSVGGSQNECLGKDMLLLLPKRRRSWLLKNNFSALICKLPFYPFICTLILNAASLSLPIENLVLLHRSAPPQSAPPICAESAKTFLHTVVMVSNQATCDGSLSLTDFRIAANEFAEKWKKFNSGFPEWLWIDCSNRLGFADHGVIDGYLSLQNMFIRRSLEEDHDDEGGCNDDEEPFDNATLVQSTNDDGDQYHFHVVYSASYRVPVLYFHAQNSDGQPLNLDEFEKNLPTKSAKVLLDSKWTFITQQEHPYLNRPWCMLHPCGTSEWMKLLLVAGNDNSTAANGIERYLISWFSVVGQVFGLKLPFEMLKSIG